MVALPHSKRRLGILLPRCTLVSSGCQSLLVFCIDFLHRAGGADSVCASRLDTRYRD